MGSPVSDGQVTLLSPEETAKRLGHSATPKPAEQVKLLSPQETKTKLSGEGAVPPPAQAPAAPVRPVSKPPVGNPVQQSPFSSGVASGIGIDPSKMLDAAGRPRGQVSQNLEVVGQAMKGIDDWAEKTVKDPAHIIDPIENLARVVEFHIPRPLGGSYDPFELKNAGIDETALDEIYKGAKSGNQTQLEHGAGRLLGGLSQIMGAVEAPEVSKVPTALKETLSDVNEARQKSKVIAAANNVLDIDKRKTIDPTLKNALRGTQEAIGKKVKNITDADKADSAANGKAGSFTKTDVAKTVVDAVNNVNATKVQKPMTAALVKALGRYGNDMTWEDLKDVRGAARTGMEMATGKDSAVLGAVAEEFTQKLAARATELGKTDDWNEYTDITKRLNEHKNGIVGKLGNASTGLQLYNELAKESNKPQLNDLFGLLEKHGGVPAGFVDNLVSTRKPIHQLASLADGSSLSGMRGGRMGAVLRHPKMAGTAMVGTGALASLSPVGMTGSFVASLVAAQKVAEFMDRYDAAKRMRELGPPRGSVSNMPAPRPPLGATPTGQAPVNTQPPNAPSPSGPTASPSVGAPQPPASLQELMSRISNASKQQQVVREAAEVPKNVAPPAEVKQAPYEKFGVKIDKSKLTTPEDVKSAKEDGVHQIEELARTKYKDIQKMPVGDARDTAIKQLDKDVREAKRSVDRMQTPEISRKARDRVRKAAEPGEKPQERAVLEAQPDPATVRQGASQVSSDEDAMMRAIDLQLEAQKISPVVARAFNAIKDKYNTDIEALPILESFMSKVRGAKKPTQ